MNEALMGEQDKRLVILCVDKGRISAIAKGAKKPGGKLASQAQLFYYCDFMLEQSKGFWMVREASIIESFYGLRKDIEALAWASWMAETAQVLTVEGEECNDLLKLLIRGLKMVTEPQLSAKMTAVTFVLRALAENGLQPEVDRCVQCGASLGIEPSLSAMAGGALCPECTKRFIDSIRMNAGGMYTLRHILSVPPETVYKFNATEEIQESLFQFATRFLHNYVQKDMASLEFLKNLYF